MGVSSRLKSRFRKFLQRPGTTVNLAPFQRRLPGIEAREDELRELDDAALTAAATPEERRAAYAADVTYVSVSEAGFDYLRDQLVTDVTDRVQRELATAVVDEAD